MSESNTSQNIMEVISPILDEYTKWYSVALSSILKANTSPIPNSAGGVLKNFLTTLNNDHFITNIRATELLNLQDTVQTTYEQATQTSVESPFKDLYETFFTQLRALERDCVLENSGLDYLTGLHSKSVMIRDIVQELERLSRKGSSFSLALIQIDRYDDIATHNKNTASLQYTRQVADLVKRSIRSFDVAYRSGPGEFVLILKQSDISGGLSAIARMHKDLEDKEITVEIDGQDTPLSLSTCVAVPVEHDIAEDLVKNLRTDLKNGAGHKGDSAILEYQEISPVQRYMQEEKGS